MSPKLITPPPSTGMTKIDGRFSYRVLDVSPFLATGRQATCELSSTVKDYHPGKGDPLFRIASRPGPSIEKKRYDSDQTPRNMEPHKICE